MYCSSFFYRPKFISADVYAHQKVGSCLPPNMTVVRLPG